MWKMWSHTGVKTCSRCEELSPSFRMSDARLGKGNSAGRSNEISQRPTRLVDS